MKTIFFEKYTDNTRKVQETMRYMGIDLKIIVLEDLGFLSEEVSLLYEYFVSLQNQEEHMERELTCEIGRAHV